MSPTGIALSLLIGISLGFFGGGGSILTVPLLVYVFGLETKDAIASSLLVVGAASVAGAVQHWARGSVDLRTGLLFGSAGMLGAYAGGRSAAIFEGSILMLLFAAMMVLTSLAMWRGRSEEKATAAPAHPTLRLLAQGLAVGLFTGLVGAGGGFLIVPALALWAGLPIPVAVGTSLLIIVMKSLAGFSGYLSHATIDYELVAVVSATAIAGSFLGSALAHRANPESLRRAFSAFVMVMAVFILGREAEAWMGTARDALPSSTPEILFALLILAIGIGAGRASQRAGGAPGSEHAYEEGAGI
jgi:uncharacterized membrane protein YfcA